MRPLRLLALLALAAAVAFAAAPPARAHSELVETTPASEEVVAQSPAKVVLRFDERVNTALGSVRVYDGSGARVDAGDLEQPEPESVATTIDGALESGTYTVAWRVISEDSDPTSGAFVFHVGAPGAQPGGIASDVVEETPRLVSFLYAGARFLDYVLLLLSAGGALALVLVLPPAAPPLRRRLYTALAWLAAGLVPVAIAALVLQGARAGGLGLGEAFGWDVVSSVAGTRFGEMALVQAGIAAALAVTAFVLGRRDGVRAALACCALAAALLVTPPASGHASAAGVAALVADYAHIVAAAAWTGGLAFLVAALLLARGDRWPLASQAVPRFSRLAVAAVAVLIAAGVVNGYQQVGTWRGLWDTEYGVLLLAKAGLVIPLLGLGAFNNRFAVPRLRAGSASPAERRRFLRMVGAELAVMVVIVGITSVLVNAAPASKLVASHGGAAAQTVKLGPFIAHVTVSPARAGANDIRLSFGHGVPPAEVEVAATLESEMIGPLRFKTRMVAHGEFVARGAQLQLAGDWQLRIEARESEFVLHSETVSIEIVSARA